MNTILYRCLAAAIVVGPIATIAGLLRGSVVAASEKLPAVGQTANDFSLQTVDGEQVQLSSLIKKGPVILLVLRGFPGYQCPICTAQVGQYLANAKKFDAKRANVILVYPGPADGLKQHAQEFIRGKTLPGNFYLALDPDYDFTNAYQLRWEAKNETAYPSTFVIDHDGKITFAKISMTHGGRASVEDVLAIVGGK